MGGDDPAETTRLLSDPASVATDNDEPANQSTYGTNDGEEVAKAKASGDEEIGQNGNENEILFDGLPEVRKNLKYIVPALGIGIFLTAADQTIIVAAYGKIGTDLHSLSNTSWIATSYYLTLTSLQPLYGKLSDIFGRKSCVLFAYTIFGLGCLFCGLSQDMNQLVASRAVAGIGGGGMTTVVSIIMSDIVPLRQRGTWQGILNILYAAGSGCGAPLGGLMADQLGWRWAFIIQVPVCVLAFMSVALALHLPSKEVSDWKTKLRRIDFLGAFTLVSAVFCLIFGLDRGANQNWASAIAIVPLCISFPLFAVFIYVEFKVAHEPFAPKHIIFARGLSASFLCNFASFAAWMGMLFYLPLYYQAVDMTTASQAGLRLIPAVVASTLGSLGGGLFMQKTGKYYWLLVGSYILFTIAFIPIILSSGILANSTWGISTGLFLMALGGGTGVTCALIAVIANAKTKDQAIATACTYLFRSLGSVVGVSLSATVVQQSLKMQLRDRLKQGKDADSIERNIRQSLDYINTLPPRIQVIARECYGNAARNGYILMILIGSFSILGALYVKETKLSK